MMSVSNARDLVWEYERAKTGVEKLSDSTIHVINVKVKKNSITADIIIHDYDGNTQEHFNKCEYPIKDLEEFHEKRVLKSSTTTGIKPVACN